jgi:hypothetical protein
MLRAFEADAFEASPSAEDLAFFENEVTECDAKLAEIGYA